MARTTIPYYYKKNARNKLNLDAILLYTYTCQIYSISKLWFTDCIHVLQMFIIHPDEHISPETGQCLLFDLGFCRFDEFRTGMKDLLDISVSLEEADCLMVSRLVRAHQ